MTRRRKLPWWGDGERPRAACALCREPFRKQTSRQEYCRPSHRVIAAKRRAAQA